VGRAVGDRASAMGNDVVSAARRKHSPAGGHAVRLDVRDEASVARGVAAAVEVLGGLDAVVYTAGTAHLGRIVDHDVDRWRDVLETNVVGVALVAAAVAPHLAHERGVLLVLSSTIDERERWGLETYGVSKAALNRLVVGLRGEHPDVRFVRATIGNTAGTEFGGNFTDGDLLREAMARWVVSGQHTKAQMPLDGVADVIVGLLALLHAHPDVDVPKLNLEPPGGLLTMPPDEQAFRQFFSG